MRQLVLLITLIVPALTACSPPHCEVDGVQHNIGESYPCADGCNTCTCTVDGESHTDMDCNIDSGDSDDTAASGIPAE